MSNSHDEEATANETARRRRREVFEKGKAMFNEKKQEFYKAAREKATDAREAVTEVKDEAIFEAKKALRPKNLSKSAKRFQQGFPAIPKPNVHRGSMLSGSAGSFFESHGSGIYGGIMGSHNTGNTGIGLGSSIGNIGSSIGSIGSSIDRRKQKRGGK